MDYVRMDKIIFILVLIVLLLFIVGCADNNDLVGTWNSDSGEIIEFLSDGTIIISDQFFSASGNYSIVENNRVRLELDGLWGMAGAQVFNYSVSGNQLNLEGDIYTKSQ